MVQEEVSTPIVSPVMFLFFMYLFTLKLDPGNHLSSEVESLSWWVIAAPVLLQPALVLLAGLVGVAVKFYQHLQYKKAYKEYLAQQEAEAAVKREEAWQKLQEGLEKE